MSINPEEQSHGVVALRLWEELGINLPSLSFSISTMGSRSRSSYILKAIQPKMLGTGKEVSAGLFIKVSNKRASPWRYSFHKDHQDEILDIHQQHGEVFIILVAGTDGIACVNFESLKQILDDHHEEQEWVSLSRKLRQNYRLAGNDGSYERPLPKNTFPRLITDHFKNIYGL